MKLSEQVNLLEERAEKAEIFLARLEDRFELIKNWPEFRQMPWVHPLQGMGRIFEEIKQADIEKRDEKGIHYKDGSFLPHVPGN